ncbi:MAG: hypothetical protein U5P41_13040 [Gammaproteobacteria bacterium]|nr:hypothetical protein [Gammaproteobacteria bacterium]
MNTPSHDSKHWLDRPGNVDRIVHTLYALCGISVLLEFVVERHETLGFAGWFAFYAWYGFIACVGLVLAAKGLRLILIRREDYYTAREPDAGDKASDQKDKPE